MAGMFGNLFGNSAPIVHNGGPGGHTSPAPAPSPASPPAAAPAPTPAAPTEPSSPLDNHRTFWDNLKDAQGKDVAPAVDPTTTGVFNFDPAKIADSAKNLNFTGNVSQELVTEALAGSDKSPAALVALMNQVAQNAVAAMTVQTGKLIDQGLVANNDRIKTTLPRHIKQVQLDQTSSDNPVLSHAAAQPLVAAMKRAAFAKDPNADPAAVNAAVESYLSDFATALLEGSPTALAAKQQKAAGETNWMEYIKS